MDTLTLVPRTLAAIGHRFTFQGDPKAMECEGCPVRQLCFSRLTPGRRYEVTNVRAMEHPCELHDEGRVLVCSVKEVPFRSSVQSTELRGTATHWTPVACGRLDCSRYGFCHPTGPVVGAKMAIAQDHGTMECPAGFTLHDVTLQPME